MLSAVADQNEAEPAPVDQSIRAVADPAPERGERILRWWGRNRRKRYEPPAGSQPRLFARASFATNHPISGVVAFCNETRGSYMPWGDTYIIDASTALKAGLYRKLPWKTPPEGGPVRKPLSPGMTGDWCEITGAMNYGYRNLFVAKARRQSTYGEVPDGTVPAFRVDFSRDGTNVIGSIANNGCEFAVGLVSLARGTVETEIELSEADLACARATGDRPTKHPRRFPVNIGTHIRTDRMAPQAVSNEVEALRILGPNSFGSKTVTELVDPDHSFEPPWLWRSPPGSHMFNRHFGCICSPDYVGITNQLKTLLETQAGPLARGRKLIVGTADEPHYFLYGLTNCMSRTTTCRERFGRDFVLDPAEDLDGYLATVAYRDKMVNDFYKAITDAAQAIHSNIYTVANIGIALVFSGNASDPGTSPFSMADAGALSVGQTEDWCNLQRTGQVSAYMCDVYRAAYGRNGKPFQMCCIIASQPVTEAKAFCEVGHGVAAISFFHYGPHWMGGDARNIYPTMYHAIRHFSEAMAEAEDAVVGSRVARGDAALLFSESCDRLQMPPGWKRNWIDRTPYGKDRMATSLMLAHCGVRTDILDEIDLPRRLGEYRVLFATDRNISRAAVAALAEWMRGGGVVVRTRGALVADERDEPFPEGFLAAYGRVVELDFSPWFDYLRPAKQLDECYSHRNFDNGLLSKMAGAVESAGVTRRVFTDDPLVEASLLENNGASVVALANWSTNSNPRVSIRIESPPPFKDVRSARGFDVAFRREGSCAVIEAETGWGDFLVLE